MSRRSSRRSDHPSGLTDPPARRGPSQSGPGRRLACSRPHSIRNWRMTTRDIAPGNVPPPAMTRETEGDELALVELGKRHQHRETATTGARAGSIRRRRVTCPEQSRRSRAADRRHGPARRLRRYYLATVTNPADRMLCQTGRSVGVGEFEGGGGFADLFERMSLTVVVDPGQDTVGVQPTILTKAKHHATVTTQ